MAYDIRIQTDIEDMNEEQFIKFCDELEKPMLTTLKHFTLRVHSPRYVFRSVVEYGVSKGWKSEDKILNKMFEVEK